MGKFIVGTDIGGTFTDVIGIEVDTGEIRVAKVPSTPPTFFEGVINGLKKAGISGEECISFRHGATVSTNAILERKGVKTGLITTKGFRDVLGGGRAERISAFELDWDPPPLIIPRRNVLTVEERVGPWGDVIIPLNEEDVRIAARKFKKRGIESIAVVFMDSFMNVEHEKRTEEILKEELPDVDITCSYKIRPEMLEFERTTTTVLNAYISPIMRNYLKGLSQRLKEDWNYTDEILITTSGGGVIGAEEAINLPARTFHSSPVSGAVGMAGYIGSLAGFDNIIAFETGGTTNNVSMIYRGEPAITHEWKILWNVPCCLPSVDTVYLGAGGGSIGWVDKGGILNVGPQSMGAVPGPACYGMGGDQPTNTDCQIVLGRINPDYFLGGQMKVNPELSYKALEKIGNHYGWSVEEAAFSMYKVATSNLMMALRLQTVARGWDPRDFAMVPYGGGGTLYAVDLSKELGVGTVVVPPLPGYASAFGATRVDVKHEFTRPLHKVETEIDFNELNQEINDAIDQALGTLKKEGIDSKNMVIRRYLDVKYFNQSSYFTIEVPPGEITDLTEITDNFLKAMKETYGYVLPPGYVEMEIVNLRIVALGIVKKPMLAEVNRSGNIKDAYKETRKVYFEETNGFTDTPIFERDNLPTGKVFEGPAIVEQPDTTIVMPPGCEGKADGHGNLVIKILK